jgi:hypothetical protein
MEKEVKEFIQKTNDRLAALEIVHTRYRGPKGEQGKQGEQGPAGKDGRDGKDGKDSNEIERIFAMRTAFREELNDFRDAIHRIGNEGLARVREIHDAEIEAFCAMRDKACAELASRHTSESTTQNN